MTSCPTGRKFRVLTVIDKWHRLCVTLQADLALTGQSVVDAMNEIAQERELPYAITVDHGTEFTSKVARRVVLPARREARLHTAGQAHREQLHRVVQRTAARRVSERERVCYAGRSASGTWSPGSTITITIAHTDHLVV